MSFYCILQRPAYDVTGSTICWHGHKKPANRSWNSDTGRSRKLFVVNFSFWLTDDDQVFDLQYKQLLIFIDLLFLPTCGFKSADVRGWPFSNQPAIEDDNGLAARHSRLAGGWFLLARWNAKVLSFTEWSRHTLIAETVYCADRYESKLVQ